MPKTKHLMLPMHQTLALVENLCLQDAELHWAPQHPKEQLQGPRLGFQVVFHQRQGI